MWKAVLCGCLQILNTRKRTGASLGGKQHVSTEVTDKGLCVMAKVHLKENPHEYIKIFLLLSKTRAEKIQLSCQKNKVCNFCSVFT